MPPPPQLEVWSIRVTSPDTQSATCPFRLTVQSDDPHQHGKPVDAQFFLQAMMNRMGVSYHKYGSIADKFPHGALGTQQVYQRLERYLDTGNVEWLVDAANYCMIEALRPGHPKAHFRATGSDESPGRVNLDGTVSHGR